MFVAAIVSSPNSLAADSNVLTICVPYPCPLKSIPAASFMDLIFISFMIGSKSCDRLAGPIWSSNMFLKRTVSVVPAQKVRIGLFGSVFSKVCIS